MVTAQDIMKQRYVRIDVKETASKLLGKLRQEHDTVAVVFDGTKYLGIVGKQWFLTSRTDPTQMKLQNLLKKRSKAKTQFFVPQLKPETNLKQMCKLMATADVKCLPVMKGSALIGVVRGTDLIRELRDYYKTVPASEVGNMRVLIANETDQMGKLLKAMHTKRVHRMPVVNKADKLVGIATAIDLMHYVHQGPRKGMHLSAAAKHNRWKTSGKETGEKQDLLKQPLSNIMTRTCCTARPNASVAAIIDKMMADTVTSVVLIEAQKPVGIITIKDILQDFARNNA